MADCYFGCPQLTFPDFCGFSKQIPTFSKTSRCACRKRSTRARARGDDSVPRVAETREQSTAAMFHVHQDAASTTQPRSFEQYRYAIEAGLMSPHDARRHILPWESATRDSTVSRSSKRYHDHEDAYADEVNKENADARCVYLFSNGSHAAPRAKPARHATDDEKHFLDFPRRLFRVAHLRPRRPPFPTAARVGDGSGKPRDHPG